MRYVEYGLPHALEHSCAQIVEKDRQDYGREETAHQTKQADVDRVEQYPANIPHDEQAFEIAQPYPFASKHALGQLVVFEGDYCLKDYRIVPKIPAIYS